MVNIFFLMKWKVDIVLEMSSPMIRDIFVRVADKE